MLFISYDGLLDPLGHSQIIPYIKNISDNENQVNILSFEKKDNLKKKKNLINDLLKKNIKWNYLQFTKKKFFLIKLYDVLKIIIFPIYLHIIYKFDVVHCRGHVPQFSGTILKIFFKIKLIFDCRGFWADERFDDNSWSNKNFLHKYSYKFIKKCEIYFFKKSNHIVVLTHTAKNILLDMDILNNKITVIPCCADYKKFNIYNDDFIYKFKKSLNLDKNKILGYIGSISSLYMLEEMLTFFKELIKINSEYRFLILTKQINHLINYVNNFDKNLIMENKVIIKSVNGDEISKYINTFNFSLCFIKSTYARQASSPTKIAESMACGIPVICNSGVGDIDYLIPKIQKFGVYNFHDHKNINVAVRDILNLNDIKKTTIRSKSQKYFDLSIANELYKKIYEKFKIYN